MILVADSSALIALAIVDKLEVLDKLFVEVSSNINFNVTLGKGESEAIILYKELNGDFLLCDDKKAKKFAQNFGITVIGSLGILLKAKERGLITHIKPLLNILKSSKVFIDEKTCSLVLKMANE